MANLRFALTTIAPIVLAGPAVAQKYGCPDATAWCMRLLHRHLWTPSSFAVRRSQLISGTVPPNPCKSGRRASARSSGNL